MTPLQCLQHGWAPLRFAPCTANMLDFEVEAVDHRIADNHFAAGFLVPIRSIEPSASVLLERTM